MNTQHLLLDIIQKLDNGEGNIIWLQAVTNESIQKPTTDKVIIARDQPLWLLLFGFVRLCKICKETHRGISKYTLYSFKHHTFNPEKIYHQ